MKLENNSKWTNLYLSFRIRSFIRSDFLLDFYSFNSAGSMNGFESFTLDHYKAVLADTTFNRNCTRYINSCTLIIINRDCDWNTWGYHDPLHPFKPSQTSVIRL